MTQASLDGDVPWTLSDLRYVFVATVLGAGMIFAAWWGASATGRQNRQIGWAVIGIAGIIVIGIGNFLWLLSGRRAVARRRSNVVDTLEGRAVAGGPAGLTGAAGPRPETLLLAVEGSTRYHAPACLLVRDKAVERGSRDSHEHAGRRPCEMCLS
jgi:hypothetical protein